MDDGCPRVVNRRRAVMIILICLPPRCSIFQLNYGPTGQTWEASRDPTHDQVHFRLACPRRCFLCRLFAVALQPAIQISQFFVSKLVEPGLMKFFRRHRLLNTFLVLCANSGANEQSEGASRRENGNLVFHRAGAARLRAGIAWSSCVFDSKRGYDPAAKAAKREFWETVSPTEATLLRRPCYLVSEATFQQ